MARISNVAQASQWSLGVFCWKDSRASLVHLRWSVGVLCCVCKPTVEYHLQARGVNTCSHQQLKVSENSLVMAALLVCLLVHSICFLPAVRKVVFLFAVRVLRTLSSIISRSLLWLKTHFIMHPPRQLLSYAKTSSHFPDGHRSQPKWLPSNITLLWQPVCTYRCSTAAHRSTRRLPDSAAWRCLPASLRADTSTGSLSRKSSCGFPILPRSGVRQGHRRKWLQATVRKRDGVFI